MLYTVYALFDEREPDAVRYIGLSCDPEKRFYSHIGEAQRSQKRSYRLNWIRKVVAEGSLIHWKTLATFETAAEAAIAEIASIKEYLATGHRLTNGTEGGEGVDGFGGALNAEARAKTTAGHRTSEYVAKRSEQSSDYWADEENRQHQREMMEFYWASEDAEVQRQIIVDTNKRIQTGKKRSAEARVKMSAAKQGKPHAKQRTPEWNEKIGAAQRGIKRRSWTPEELEKRRASMNRPEVRAKMSASAKARVR